MREKREKEWLLFGKERTCFIAACDGGDLLALNGICLDREKKKKKKKSIFIYFWLLWLFGIVFLYLGA